MDPITQNVNENIEQYLDNLVAECLQAPAVAVLPQEEKSAFAQQIRDHFYQVALEVLVDKLTEEQFKQIENLDPLSPEMVEKIQILSAQVPGLAGDLEKKLQQDVEFIKQNSKLPQQPV